ncbi:MAG: hypothetical protein HOE80_02845 [Candidatus Magasanikbacteria bacterium]|jgi:hypothetical protein|nr:hypothetical protein [Candidatus Magasanikbacteria bacterium]MBT4071636.1 hypothetical protein [Candidatus Magasanikbacteria bacterium]
MSEEKNRSGEKVLNPLSEENRLGEQVITQPEMDALLEPLDKEEDGKSKAESLKSTLEMELSGLKRTLESISELPPEDPVRGECVVRMKSFCSENSDLFA